MYCFAGPSQGEVSSPVPQEKRPSVLVDAQFESAVDDDKGETASLPLPAGASQRESPRKRRPTVHEGGTGSNPTTGQHSFDSLDLGPEYLFFSRTSSAPPKQTGPPPSGALPPTPPPKLARAKTVTMPSVDLAHSYKPPSGLDGIPGSDEETAALIKSVAESLHGSPVQQQYQEETFDESVKLATASAHPLTLSSARHQTAFEDSQPLEHLPKLEAGSTDPTAYPNWHVLAEREVELARLNSGDRLDTVLADPDAAESLRAFAASLPDPRASLLLSLYNDLWAFSAQAVTLRLASSAISSSYFLANSPLRLSLNIAQRGPTLAVLYRTAAVGHGLNEPLQAIKREVDEQVLELWVQETSIKKLNARLGMWQVGAGWTGRLVLEEGGPNARSDGLTESFCLTDPNLHDNTIVAASEGFAAVTGYPVPEIVGRNCRFLQGPGTSPASVKPLSDALLRGERVTWTVFNYRRDGTPYYNLICLNPLRDAHGKVRFILGGQTDATATMQQVLPARRSGEGGSHPASFSPTVQEQLDKLQPAHEAQRSSLGMNAAASISNSAIQEYPYLPPANPIPSHILETRTTSPAAAYKMRGRSSSGRSLPKLWKLGHRQKEDSASTASGTNGNRKNSGEDDRASVATSLGTQAGLAADFTPSNTYTKVALIDATSGQIAHATPELARLVGLSRTAYPSLAGTELVKLLAAPVTDSATSPKDELIKEQTRRLRRNVEMAIEHGHACKNFVRIKEQNKSKFLGVPTKGERNGDFRHAVLHLTPLKCAEGKVTYFAAIHLAGSFG